MNVLLSILYDKIINKSIDIAFAFLHIGKLIIRWLLGSDAAIPKFLNCNVQIDFWWFNFTKKLIIIRHRSKALSLFLLQKLKFPFQSFIYIFAELQFFNQLLILQFYDLILLQNTRRILNRLYQSFGIIISLPFVDQFMFLDGQKFLDALQLFDQAEEGFVVDFCQIKEGYIGHGFEIFAIASLTEESFGLVLQFSLSDQTFLTGDTSTNLTPIPAGRYRLKTQRAKTRYIFFFLLFYLRIEYLHKNLRFDVILTFFVIFFDSEKFDELFFGYLLLFNGQYLHVDIFFSIGFQAPFVLIDHKIRYNLMGLDIRFNIQSIGIVCDGQENVVYFREENQRSPAAVVVVMAVAEAHAVVHHLVAHVHLHPASVHVLIAHAHVHHAHVHLISALVLQSSPLHHVKGSLDIIAVCHLHSTDIHLHLTHTPVHLALIHFINPHVSLHLAVPHILNPLILHICSHHISVRVHSHAHSIVVVHAIHAHSVHSHAVHTHTIVVAHSISHSIAIRVHVLFLLKLFKIMIKLS